MRSLPAPLLLAALVPASLLAQTYGFHKIADIFTQRPDGQGNFSINGQPRPAIEGNLVVFHEPGTNAALWSYDLTTGLFTKLAGFQTPVPGGSGNFTSFSPQDSHPLIRGGTVVFLGWDSSGNRFSQGIYATRATGGAITRLADTRTASPTGGTFRTFDEGSKPFGAFALDGGRVAFTGANTSGFGGVYTVALDGTGLTRVMDNTTPFSPTAGNTIVGGTNPWISGSTVAFWGGNGFDPSTGYNGIYTAGINGGTPVERINSRMRLPNDNSNPYHTRVNIPSVQMEGSTIVFNADNTWSNSAVRGLYMLTGGGGPAVIADGKTTLSGLGAILTQSSFNSFSLNNGRVLFRAADSGPGAQNTGLFLWQNGAIARIVGRGDKIDGRTVWSVYDVSPGALNGDRMAVLIDFGPSLGAAVYAIVPAGGVAVNALQNSASYTANQVTPGGIVTLYGTGMGPAELATFQLDANNRMPFALAGTKVLMNGYEAPLLYVSANQLSAVAPYLLDFQSMADVVVVSQGRVSPPLTVAIREADPGLFSLNRQGTGPGAILNQDSTVNSPQNPAAAGSIAVLFGAGFGATNPVSVDGRVTSTTAPPRLRYGITATIGGQRAAVEYAGQAPGAIAGLYQVNVRIPEGTPAGDQPVRLTVGQSQSQEGLTLSVR